MFKKDDDIYESGLIPKNLEDGTYWNSCGGDNPIGSKGQIPIGIRTVEFKGKTVHIARWKLDNNNDNDNKGGEK